LAIFLFCMHLSAKVYSQKDVKLSLNIKELRLSAALDKIEATTGYRFFYNSKEVPLNHSITLNTNGTLPLVDVLNSILSQVNLKYQLLSNNVIALTTSSDTRFLLVRGTVKDGNGMLLPG